MQARLPFTLIDRVAHCPPAHQLSADKLQIHIHPAVDAGYRATAGELPVIHVVSQRRAQPPEELPLYSGYQLI